MRRKINCKDCLIKDICDPEECASKCLNLRNYGGLILTIDGATGYFPKAFIIEAIRTHMKRGEGEWIKDEKSKFEHRYNCSVCNYSFFGIPTNYCPNCGAKMKGGAV